MFPTEAISGAAVSSALSLRDLPFSVGGTMSDLAQLANDRYEIADALHRYAFGLDHDHVDSLASVLTEDCRFDFRRAGKKLGLEFPLLVGRDQIVQQVLPLIGPLKTSHTTSNIQIEVSGDTASLSAYVMSQHFMPRAALSEDCDFALLMNRYDCELVRSNASDPNATAESRRWRFTRITIDNAWYQGNPEFLNASAQYNAIQAKRLKPKGDKS